MLFRSLITDELAILKVAQVLCSRLFICYGNALTPSCFYQGANERPWLETTSRTGHYSRPCSSCKTFWTVTGRISHVVLSGCHHLDDTSVHNSRMNTSCFSFSKPPHLWMGHFRGEEKYVLALMSGFSSFWSILHEMFTQCKGQLFF